MDIETLFTMAQDGDEVARDELLCRLRERFKLFLHHRIWDRNDAEDILQDALMTIEQKYRHLEIEKSFAAWAHKVLINQVYQYYRKKGIQGDKLTQLELQTDGRQLSSSGSDLERQLRDCLRKLNRVNKRHARIINLHYLGYTTEEICQKFNICPNNLYLLLFRARAVLKRCLETGAIDP